MIGEYIYRGLGFPIKLESVEIIKVRGVDVPPNINFNKLMKVALAHLVGYKTKLRGSHIFFIRSYFELSLEEFIKKFHLQSVNELKNVENDKSTLNWAVEKNLRLYILTKINLSNELLESYLDLFEERPTGGEEVIFSQGECKYVV